MSNPDEFYKKRLIDSEASLVKSLRKVRQKINNFDPSDYCFAVFIKDSWEDEGGKSIGVATAGSLSEVLFKTVVAYNLENKSNVSLIEMNAALGEQPSAPEKYPTGSKYFFGVKESDGTPYELLDIKKARGISFFKKDDVERILLDEGISADNIKIILK